MQSLHQELSRRNFVALASGGCIGLPLGFVAGDAGAMSAQDDPSPADDKAHPGFPPGFPSQDLAVAGEVVGKSHFDLEAIKKLVEARPALAKASYDWGFGDWETALGAASHVGRRDIAEVLIANGARPDIFTFTMFGQLDAVKAIIAANPGVQRIPGPHGITLLAHARAGDEGASAVVEYLQSLGDADPVAQDLPLDPPVKASMLGDYIYELAAEGQPMPQASCAIIETKTGGLAFRHGGSDGGRLRLLHQGDDVFHPAGAPRVRISFAKDRLTIEDGGLRLAARKR